jgi:hypothetical protein
MHMSWTICDTQKQVERFVQLFDENPQAAMSAVNAEENDPNAYAQVDVSNARCRAAPHCSIGGKSGSPTRLPVAARRSQYLVMS